MTTSRLDIYNIAADFLGETELATLTEDRELRRKLDQIWTHGNGLIYYVLEKGYWSFAKRTVELEPSSNITISFGFSFAYQIPIDYVQLFMLSADDRFLDSLKRYEKETDYFHCDVNPLYMTYISDDAEYGADLSRWPTSVANWAGAYMATKAAPKITSIGGAEKKEIIRQERALLTEARSEHAMDEPPRYPQLSSWASARTGRNGHWDRGNRNRLIG